MASGVYVSCVMWWAGSSLRPPLRKCTAAALCPKPWADRGDYTYTWQALFAASQKLLSALSQLSLAGFASACLSVTKPKAMDVLFRIYHRHVRHGEDDSWNIILVMNYFYYLLYLYRSTLSWHSKVTQLFAGWYRLHRLRIQTGEMQRPAIRCDADVIQCQWQTRWAWTTQNLQLYPWTRALGKQRI